MWFGSGRRVRGIGCDYVYRGKSGFLVERDSPTQTSTYGEGVYWSPEEYGFIGRRVALKAYACPDCGYIEQYVRFLEDDKDKVLRAPTRREEQKRQ